MVEVNRQRKLALRFEPPPFQGLDRLVKKARTTIEKTVEWKGHAAEKALSDV